MLNAPKEQTPIFPFREKIKKNSIQESVTPVNLDTFPETASSTTKIRKTTCPLEIKNEEKINRKETIHAITAINILYSKFHCETMIYVTKCAFWTVVQVVTLQKTNFGLRILPHRCRTFFRQLSIPKGTGTVKGCTVTIKGNNSVYLTINNVNYVPDQRSHHLLYVTAFIDKVCKIKLENDRILIFDKNFVIRRS